MGDGGRGKPRNNYAGGGNQFGVGYVAAHLAADEAFTALGLLPGAAPAAVRAAYHARAKNLHPDAGGDTAEFSGLNAAYLAALRYARAETCPTCGGTGRATEGRGFAQMPVRCAPCKGSGQRHNDT